MVGLLTSPQLHISLFGLSAAALLSGPVLLQFANRFTTLLRFIDGFVLALVAGLVLADILPHAMATVGWWSIALALLGFAGPSAIEILLRRAAHGVHTVALFIGMSGLALHAGIDGLGLAGAGHSGLQDGVAIAILAHRLPEGMAIWWLVGRSRGPRLAAVALALVLVLTASGMLVDSAATVLVDSTPLAALQSIIAGTLLHVLVHRPHNKIPQDKGKIDVAVVLGTISAIVVVALLLILDGHEGHELLHHRNFTAELLHVALCVVPTCAVAFVLLPRLSGGHEHEHEH